MFSNSDKLENIRLAGYKLIDLTVSTSSSFPAWKPADITETLYFSRQGELSGVGWKGRGGACTDGQGYRQAHVMTEDKSEGGWCTCARVCGGVTTANFLHTYVNTWLRTSNQLPSILLGRADIEQTSTGR